MQITDGCGPYEVSETFPSKLTWLFNNPANANANANANNTANKTTTITDTSTVNTHREDA